MTIWSLFHGKIFICHWISAFFKKVCPKQVFSAWEKGLFFSVLDVYNIISFIWYSFFETMPHMRLQWPLEKWTHLNVLQYSFLSQVIKLSLFYITDLLVHFLRFRSITSHSCIEAPKLDLNIVNLATSLEYGISYGVWEITS